MDDEHQEEEFYNLWGEGGEVDEEYAINYLPDLTTLINDEQLLLLALHSVAYSTHKEIVEIAEKIIVCYVVKKYKLEGKTTFSELEITKDIEEMIVSYTLETMAKQGLLDADLTAEGEVEYSMTNLGKEVISKRVNKEEQNGN